MSAGRGCGRANAGRGTSVVESDHEYYGRRRLLSARERPTCCLRRMRRIHDVCTAIAEGARYVKDGINDYVVHGDKSAVNPEQIGSKAAAHYVLSAMPGQPVPFDCASPTEPLRAALSLTAFDAVFAQRIEEADEFYARSGAGRCVCGCAQWCSGRRSPGLLWSKQFYHYDVRPLAQGRPARDRSRRGNGCTGSNSDWTHLYNADVISMPDKWEYPWYAAWDLAFHCIPLALVDPTFAKEQLVLMLREWYMHPNGQIPAYEWAFGDVNPPVHAWAAWRVYKIEKKRKGVGDRVFLERVFHKLLLNFTWWVNRKDAEGKNIFQGGFLGLDNIGVFDRSAPLPTGGHIEQSDEPAGWACIA